MANPLKLPLRGRYLAENFEIRRDSDQLVKIVAADSEACAYAMGMCHWADRALQMYLQKIVAQGRVCELLQDSPENLELDLFVRRMEFFYSSREEASNLVDLNKKFLSAYCQGVNQAMKRHQPFELKLAKIPLEPWTAADTLATVKLVSFMGMAQCQLNVEKFIIQALKGGIEQEFLQQLFAPNWEKLDGRILEIIKELKVFNALLPQRLFELGPPAWQASNNWVLSGKRSTSGTPLVSADPHLNIQRLPAFWYEMKHLESESSDYFACGVSVPGIPGLIMGRTNLISFNFTYGTMDTLDYFIEDIVDQKFKLEDQYKKFNGRKEEIKRKNNSSQWLLVNKTECGRLECPDHYREGGAAPVLENGYYLSLSWSGSKVDSNHTMDLLINLPKCKTVAEAQKLSAKLFISANWLFSDTSGNIGYQQSGLLPLRQGKGLLPLCAWEEKNHWQGTLDCQKLHRITNPPEGFLATANNNMNDPNGPLSINLSLGDYRCNRIKEFISERGKFNVTDMKALQSDLKSLHAIKYLKKIKKLIPDTPAGRILSDWDGRYHVKSQGAFLFHKFYFYLLEISFGQKIFRQSVWQYCIEQPIIISNIYFLLDRLLLEISDEEWREFFKEDRESLFKEALDVTLKRYPPSKVRPWGKENYITFRHLLFQRKWPFLLRLLGINKGPYPLPGHWSTVVQASIFNSETRPETIGPSWRFVCDMGEKFSFTSLPGGSSDRPFSSRYSDELNKWCNFQYKVVFP